MAQYKILVVDNSPVLLKLVATFLQEAGHATHTANNGLEAYDALSRFQPDIVVSDLVMPEIDGVSLCRLIRNNPRYQHLYLIILSGIAIEDAVHLGQIDADVTIAKGPAATIRRHLLEAIACFERGERRCPGLWNAEGLWSREITRELLALRRHSEVVLDGIREGVVELNRFGRIITINPSAVHMLGSDDIQALAGRFSDYFAPNDAKELEGWLGQTILDSGAPSFQRNDDNPLRVGDRWLCLNLVPVHEEDACCIIGILRDITERLRLEDERHRMEELLAKAQRLETMSRMAGGLAHDFNNLLTVISGNIEMARLASPTGGTVAGLIDEAERALRMAVQLMHKISDASDNVSVNRQSVSLAELLRDLLALALPKGQISYRLDLEEAPWPVQVDTDHIGQIVGNILQNAREAMEQRGTIAVRLVNVEGEQERRHHAFAIGDGHYVRISISDSGPGIAPELRERIFDPYFSTKQRGTQKGMGLGLTIVYSLIRKHGGFVRAESPTTGGCTIHLYLPTADAEPRTAAVATSNISPRNRVLVMDDELLLRNLAQKMLTRLGYDVTVVDRGEEAVRIVVEAREMQQPYAAVILDLNMEYGLDGLATARRLRELGLACPLIVSSGDPTHELMVHPDNAGFSGILPKPYTVEILRDLLEKLIPRQ
ncbi:MAG: hypothetical protein BWK76_09240 [Desulfobulbaceae bacterium A2]|nr:MAG: hypothetical protein BWK76_09240 [Desulfobulbaceae bacterium A2]